MGSQGKLWNNLTLAIAFQGLLQFILPFVAKIDPICSELNVCVCEVQCLKDGGQLITSG